MTREEAVKHLTDIKEWYTPDRDFSYYGDEYHGLSKEENKAIDMAISTLKEQENKTTNIIANRPKGSWSNHKIHIGESEKVRTCSNCRITQTVNTYKGKVMFKYCPYCGAEMNEKSQKVFW